MKPTNTESGNGLSPAIISNTELRSRIRRLNEDEAKKAAAETNEQLNGLVERHGLFESIAGVRLALEWLLAVRCDVAPGQIRLILQELERGGW